MPKNCCCSCEDLPGIVRNKVPLPPPVFQAPTRSPTGRTYQRTVGRDVASRVAVATSQSRVQKGESGAEGQQLTHWNKRIILKMGKTLKNIKSTFQLHTWFERNVGMIKTMVAEPYVIVPLAVFLFYEWYVSEQDFWNQMCGRRGEDPCLGRDETDKLGSYLASVIGWEIWGNKIKVKVI